MTTKERIQRMLDHKEADRIPVTDGPWASTIERWQREGMPIGADYRDFFDIDKITQIGVDVTPRYPEKTIEETDDYIIYTTGWGTTLKEWKHKTSTPEFMDRTITSSAKWEEAKARMTFDESRIPWDYLRANYAKWRNEGHWLEGMFWFGFDVTHSWTVGTETLLMALIEEPEWCVDMFNTYLDLNIRLFDRIWDAGYTFDAIFWYDDMGYKNTQFFSLDMYRQLLKPVHKRAVEWARGKGIKAHLHSCGDVNPFIPELIEIGVDILNPLEVKAGMDPVEIKKKYGGKLVLHGGVNAVLWDDKEAITQEMRRVIPVLKENGGYIFSSDHSVPDSVSLEEFKYITDAAKELGKY